MAQFGAPNFLAAIDAYEAGSRRAERNRLAELDRLGNELQGKALSGDQNALAQLGQVNPQAYMQTKQFSQQEKAQRLDELAAGAMAADTPEKWRAFVQRAAAQGHTLDPGETRESILDQAMGWKEKLAQSNVDRQFNQNKSNADRGYNLDVQQFNETRRYHDAQLEAGGSNKPPQGYRYTADNNLEAIPGGPADPRVKASQGAGGVTTKMHNDAVSVDQAYRNLDGALKDYESLVKKTGISMLPGEENDAVQQARTNLQLQLKELYNLGVLNGPDLSLMQNMIFDPQTAWLDPIGNVGKVYGAMGLYGGTSVGDRATKSIGNLRDMLQTIRDNKTKGILDENGNFIGGGAPPADDLGGLDGGGQGGPANADALIEQANDAIARGADPAKVRARLLEQGVEADFGE